MESVPWAVPGRNHFRPVAGNAQQKAPGRSRGLWCLPPAVVPAIGGGAAVADQEAMVGTDRERKDECREESRGVFGKATMVVLMP